MAYRTFVLGDIHGELEALEQVFALASFDFDKDVLVQIGDLCDRGKSSFEVVELLKQCRQLVLIEGNHDQWLKAYVEFRDPEPDKTWLQQGAMDTLASYAKHGADPVIHQPFYAAQVPYFVDDDRNCFVHGGFDRSLPIAAQQADMLAWNRTMADEMMEAEPGSILATADQFNHVYFGHTPTTYWGETKPITRGGFTNIDTGCGKGGLLTLMDIRSGEYWQSERT